MVSPSKPNHSRVANDKDKCKLVKGSKPLINFKFYLDIEKHNISTLIENKIKEFGGSIEFFLIKEVTHFVTDKLLDDNNDEHNNIPGQSPLSLTQSLASSINDLSSIITVSPIQNINLTTNTNDTKGTTTRHQSRANAMLHRARLTKQQQTNCNKTLSSTTTTTGTTTTSTTNTNTINVAKKFGTTIWSSDYTLKFFNKITKLIINNNDDKLIINNNNKSNLINNNNNLINNNNNNKKQKHIDLSPSQQQRHHHHHNHHNNNTKILKGNFIKIESFNKQYRPIYREFNNWPIINLNTDYSSSPFELKQQQHQPKEQQNIINNRIMTRKGRPKKKITEQKQQHQQVEKKLQQDKDDKQSNTTTTTTTNTNTTTTTTTTNNELTTNSKCGYCELCHVEYDILKIHLKTDEHRNFAKNDVNFLSLDRLIKNGTNVEQFIKLNTAIPTTTTNITTTPPPTTVNTKIKQQQQKSSSKQQSSSIVHVFGKRTITKQQQQQQKTNIIIKNNGKLLDYNNCVQNDVVVDCVTSVNAPLNNDDIVSTTTTISNNKRRISGSGDVNVNNQIINNCNNETIKIQEQLPSSTTAKRSNNNISSSGNKTSKSNSSSCSNNNNNNNKRKRLNHRNNGNKRRKLINNSNNKLSIKLTINNHENYVNNIINNDKELLIKTEESINNVTDNVNVNINDNVDNDITETNNKIKQLRSRRESCKKINYAEKDDDENNTIIKVQTGGGTGTGLIKTSNRKSPSTKTTTATRNDIDGSELKATTKTTSPIKVKSLRVTDTLVTPTTIKCKKIKIRGGIRWRGPSPEERPPPKIIPVVYKVIDDNEIKTIKKMSNLTDKKNVNEFNLIKTEIDNNDGDNDNVDGIIDDANDLIKNCESKERKQKSQTTTTSTTTNGLIVKFKRVRQSELSLLSDEAENFMFPKRELSELDTDDDRQSTSEPADLSNDLISSDIIDCVDNRLEIKLETRNDRRQFNKQQQNSHHNHHHNNHHNHPDTRKKRRTQMETFLNDNSDYYKFENPGSRLRFQDAPTQPILINSLIKEEKNDLTNISTDNNDIVQMNQEDRVGGITWNTLKSQNIQKHKFSFERVPNNEPWFLAFQRQDEGKEKIFEYYGSTAYRKLPFEMGPLPPLPSNCCILNRIHQPVETVQTQTQSSQFQSKLIKQELLDDEIMEENLVNGDCENDDDEIDDDDIDDDDDDDGDTNSINTITNKKKAKSISLKKEKQLLDACHPRKSPREHASTLAILSSIVNQKRKRNKGSISSIGDIISEDNNSRNSLLIDYEQNLSPCPEDETMTEENIMIKNKTDKKQIVMPIINEKQNIIIKNNTTDYVNMNILSREIDRYFNIINLNDNDNDDLLDINIPTNINEYESYFNTKNNLIDLIKQQQEDNNKISTLTDELFNENFSGDEEIIIRKPLAMNRKLTSSERMHLARNARKRKNNRTGWPNKKRVVQIKKEKDDYTNYLHKNLIKTENINDNYNDINNDEQIDNNHDNTDENLTIDLSSCIKRSTDEIFITSTQNQQQHLHHHHHHHHHNHNHNHIKNKLNCSSNKQTTTTSAASGTVTTTTNNIIDYPNCINLFASSSDKAENSDMFTVSSDSLDSAITNITDIKIEKTIIDEDEREDGQEEEEQYHTDNLFISDDSSIDNELTTIINNKNNGINKVTAATTAKLNNSERTPVTTQLSVLTTTSTTTPTKITLTPTKIATSQQMKKIDHEGINFQPLVCVEKIDDEIMINKYGLRSTKIQNNNKKITPDKLSPKRKIQKVTPHTSPQQYSPRKLRKPRGRWYRER